MTQTDATYLSAVKTAKLVRKALKREFPDTTFSVRSGGGSIHVSWIDGPTTTQVNPVARAYEGGGFDGMIDLAYTFDSWLMPDGTATPAYSDGTTGSRGIIDGYAYAPPSPDAQLVHFGALYILTDRSDSPDAPAYHCPWCGEETIAHARANGSVQLNCRTGDCGIVCIVDAIYDPQDDAESEMP